MFRKLSLCVFFTITSLIFAYSDQVVVSQFDIGLKNSSDSIKYSLSGVSTNGVMQAISPMKKTLGGTLEADDTAGLDNSVAFNFTKKNDFGVSGSDFTYSGANGENSVIIPVLKNQSTTNVGLGSFELKETTVGREGEITNYFIQEKFSLPIKSITLSEESGQNTGNKFNYSESSVVRKTHLETYKSQTYMVRIARQNVADTNYDIIGKLNGVLEATAANNTESERNIDKFLNGTANYVDFSFVGDKYDKEQMIEGTIGVGARFKPGEISVYGLPQGQYRIELYSFRYSKDISNKGNVVITKESSLNFTANNFKPETSINLLNFSTKDFSTINATVLVASSTSNPAFNVTEAYGAGAAVEVALTSKTAINVTEIYIKPEEGTSSTAITLDSDGGAIYNNVKLYYKKYNVSYITPNTTIDDKVRIVNFNLTSGGTDTATTNYTVKATIEPITKYPHQTVFAKFSTNKTWGTGDYEVLDRNMNKYTLGYRGIKTTTASDISTLYKGIYTGNSMNLNSSFNWVGNGTATSSLIINKAVSDSKGTFSGSGGNLLFYTTLWNPALAYEENSLTAKNDTATFTWTSPNKNSFDATLNEDKVIFRVVKLNTDANGVAIDATTPASYSVGGVSYTEQLPKRYYNPYNQTNPIGSNSLTTDLSAFIAGTRDYVDLVFDSGIDNTQTIGNVSFAYSKNNKLIITGLTRAKYLVQIYSLQNEDSNAQSDDSYNYKVLTYGGYKQFEMGLPILVTGGFANRNNVFIINSIGVESAFVNNTPVKNVSLEFTTKAQQAISLDAFGANFTARNDEEENNLKSSSARVSEQKNRTGAILPVTNLKVYSAKPNFQYPLDIVLCIDNSGSMQNEIDDVTAGIGNFTTALNARGFDVKYNLVTFGSPQDSNSIGDNTVFSYENPVTHNYWNSSYTTNYLATFKGNGNWFADVSELTTALGKLRATNGYYKGQENGAWAIDRGISYLKDNGRYLDLNNRIVTHSAGVDQAGYVASQKWVVFLTDENMDTDDLPTGYTSSGVVNELAKYASDNSVNLTGIYHANVTSYSQESEIKYTTAIPTATVTQDNGFNGYYTAGGRKILSDAGGYYFDYNGVKYLYTNESLSNKATSLSNGTYYFKNVNDWRTYVDTVSVTYRNDYNNKCLNIPSASTLTGVMPADTGDRFYTDFALSTSGFNMYEMGADGEYVSTALTHAVNNIGIVQTWKMTYTSPFPNTDGLKREAIFSLTGLPSVSQFDTTSRNFVTSPLTITPVLRTAENRFYTVPLDKIQALFVKPDTTSRQIKVVNGNIELNAIAKSEYKQADGIIYNYPIKKGTFVITGLTTGAKLVVTSDETNDSRVRLREVTSEEATTSNLEGKWYRATSYVNYQDFVRRFGGDSIKIDFIAETAENSLTITVQNVSLNPPKITQVILKNNTLADFMNGLKSSATSDTVSVPTFTPVQVNEATTITGTNSLGLTNEGISAVDLNVKVGDRINVQFRVVDTDVVNTSESMIVVYGGTESVARYNATSGMWETNVIYDGMNNNLAFKAADNYGNNIVIEGSTFTIPELLDNTTIKPRSNVPTDADYNPAGASYSNYYNNGNLTTVYKSSNALAYLAVFRYVKEESDKGSTYSYYYPDRSGAKWIASTNGNFNFGGDGRYSYSKIYIVNKAGAINEITSDVVRRLPEILDAISLKTASARFYKDTVAPSATMVDPMKRLDANNELNTNSIASGMLNNVVTSTNPFKAGDTIEFMGRIADYNYLKTELSNNIYEGTEPEGTLDTDIHYYKKIGVARDLDSSALSAITSSTTVNVYDKAGNVTSTSFPLYYDDRLPSTLRSQATITGSNIKYTANSSIPLFISATAAPLSVAMVGTNYFGDVRTSTRNLGGFVNSAGTRYLANPNANNTFAITAYSHSGVKGIPEEDNIVLDTEINDSRTRIYETNVRTLNGKYSVDLNRSFSTIPELVGVSGFAITGTCVTVKGNAPVGGKYLLSGASYLTTKASHVFTVPYTLEFTSTVKGSVPFNLTVFDRLGNQKTYTYTVQIPNNITIRGKTTGATKEIKTKIDGTGKIKISSRTED